MRALRRRKTRLGKLHGTARYLVFSLFFFNMRSPAETRPDHNAAFPCSSTSSSRLAFSLTSSRHCEARGSPSAAGRATGRQMRIQRRCHVSSVYPAARVFAFGSTCIRPGLRGEYNLRWSKAAATVREEEKRFTTQRIYDGNIPLGGKMQAPGGHRMGRVWAWWLFYFQQSGKCLAAHCPAPGAPSRYTA